jgi:hypothetical protein
MIGLFCGREQRHRERGAWTIPVKQYAMPEAVRTSQGAADSNSLADAIRRMVL